jgi:general secretion pathway protein K
MTRRLQGSRRQRGVALITAMIIFALAMILAADVVQRSFLDQRRASNMLALDQGYEMALGAEAWAADFLAQDKRESGKQDTLAETWAQALPPLPLDNGGSIEGRLTDMQGRYNLNNLIAQDGTPDKKQVQLLERILQLAEIEPTWAGKIADWIDSDTQPGFPEGAEDSEYTSLTPSHLAANMGITRVSELMVLPDFGLERYRKLAPHVAALPAGTKINTCTATGVVLDALNGAEVNYSTDPRVLAVPRREGCFPSKEAFRSSVEASQQEWVEGQVTESTDYLRATIWVSIGTSEFTLYSLLHRTSTGPVRPILRSIGTE